MKAPWVKNFYFVDYDMYIIPGFEAITLGGTRNFDSYNAKVDKHDSIAIWERCLEAVPSLKDAEVSTHNKNMSQSNDLPALITWKTSVSLKVRIIATYYHSSRCGIPENKMQYL